MSIPESHAGETLVYYGGPVKAIGDNKVGGYLVRFTGPNDPDLTGEFFTKNTEFGPNNKPPLLYHHGLDGKIKSRIIGSAEWKVDDVGIWVEAQLALRDEYEKEIKRLADEGKLGWSSGAVGHAVERETVGKARHITTWLIGEASLTPTPAEPRNEAVPIKALITEEGDAEQTDAAVAESESVPDDKATKTTEQMPDEQKQAQEIDLNALVESAAAKAVESYKAEVEASKADTSEGKTVKFEGSAPAVIADASHLKYDNYSVEDLAITYEFLQTASETQRKARKPSDAMVKAMAMRLEGEDGKSDSLRHARGEMRKSLAGKGIKANEIHQSDLASGGDEWVGVAYSSDLWNKVRLATPVVNQIPQFEFPAGAESIVIPIESTDPTWYKVAQASDLSSNPGGIPTNTVTSSKLTTGNQTMTLSKIGARVLWTGELGEDAVLPFADQLRSQLSVSGAEYLESAVIDGDTATGGTTNINHIDGTPTATDYFLSFDGPRKLALVTNTANSRDAGVLSAEDFLETVKLMGTNGLNAVDKTKVKFILDVATHYKSLQLPEVKTRDVNVAATIENGDLTRIYGYDILVSGQMNKQGSGLSNTAGKVDQGTPANNTKGSILAIRPDQWRMGFRRRMTLETMRVPAADATEIVVMMRAGLQYRDNEAAAISYNVTV